MTLVGYLVYHGGTPPQHGRAYDYVLAGDGLSIAAESRHLRARVPVAMTTIRGLPPLHPFFAMRHGRLPQAIWNAIVATMRNHVHREILVAVVVQDSRYRLVRPPQVGAPHRVLYRPPADALLEIHSHGHHPARFSPTDDADEQGFRVYGVVGCLDTDQPEVALRVGVYGHFLSLPWEAVFAGDRSGIWDAAVASADVWDGTDELHH
jgi:PRTRC genetic system protein A